MDEGWAQMMDICWVVGKGEHVATCVLLLAVVSEFRI